MRLRRPDPPGPASPCERCCWARPATAGSSGRPGWPPTRRSAAAGATSWSPCSRPGAVRVPMGVVIDTARLPGPGTDVHLGAGVIGFGSSTWRPTRWWDPRPRVQSGRPRRRTATRSSGRSAPSRTEAFGLPLAEELSVAAAIARGDAQAAHAVIGLGPGLTPSGDDVVAGALVALALLSRLDADTCARRPGPGPHAHDRALRRAAGGRDQGTGDPASSAVCSKPSRPPRRNRRSMPGPTSSSPSAPTRGTTSRPEC